MTLTSLWRDRHPHSQPSGEVTVGGEYDVIVVGAGITGLTTALLLARAGRSVAVVEARHLGAGTTGGSTAKVSLLQGTVLSRISRRHPDSVVRDYVAANTEGQAWLARFCADHGVEAQRRPAYTFATSGRGRRAARAEYATARKAGLAVTWLDRLDLPFHSTGAARLEDQLQLDPMELLESLAREAAAHGATILEGIRVRHVTGRDPVRVVADVGAASARTVVVATNMPILDRGAFFARAKPDRSYGLAFRTREPAVDGMYLSADEPSRSLRDAPDPSGSLLLVGGNGHKPGAAVSERQRLDELRHWTDTHFPGAEETHAWSAQDYVPHHALPFVGPVLPGREEVLVAGGYAKWGLTNGTAAALALSGRILGGHQEWAEVFEPWRSHELRGLVDSARLNGEVGLEMTWGWLRPVVRPGVGAPSDEGQGSVRLDRVGTPTAAARVDGAESRVSAVCSHLGGIVRWNDAERSWDCPLHGSRFRPDGEVLEGPATCGLSRR
jgi:glycine/D-amino acid oxidase-like deaminating enzyme/nitrite reductase/ring-hydroxylating ferredoxin subunit